MAYVKKGGKGGRRPGAGRPPKAKKLSNYERGLRLLDESIEPALKVLINGLRDKNKQYRLRCAEILLRKSIADKKEITGQENGPVQIEIIKRIAREPAKEG